MTWAERQGATHVVDVATLTGAVSRALGRSMTGGFGTDDPFWAEMADAARRQGEPLWRLPIVEDYRADMDSPYADIVVSLAGNVHSISARPSDAVAIAVRFGAPVYAEEGVLDEAGRAPGEGVPDEIVEQFKEFIDQVNPDDFAS